MDQSPTQKRRGLRFRIPVLPRPLPGAKNFFVFAAILFSGDLFNLPKLFLVFLVFVIFGGLISAMYLFNDVIDAPRDKLHPVKKERLVAKGLLNPKVALFISFVLSVVFLALSFILSPLLFAVSLVFVLLQVTYSLALKNVILLDFMVVAAGYLLRVYAGALIIEAHVTVWFLLAVVSLSLLLAVGKRRAERTLLLGAAPAHRKVLLYYPDLFLDLLVIMFATGTWITYTMFTFLEPLPPPEPQVLVFLGEILPRTLIASKFLMVTIPPVLYGLMRYLYIIYEKKEGGSPEEVLLRDYPLLVTVLLWFFLTVFVLYGPFSGHPTPFSS